MRAFDSLSQAGRLRRLRLVAAHALRRFDVPEYRLALQADSFNTVFRVSGSGATYLLRVGPERAIHEQGAALAELEWIGALADLGLPVPRIVRASDGAASVHVGAPGVPGQRECTLLTWRTGLTLTRPVGPTDIADLAVLSANLHRASAPLYEKPSGVLDGRRVLRFRIPELLAEAPGDSRAVLREALLRAQQGLGMLWASAPGPPRLIHSDLTPNNVVRSRGRLAAIDFQDLTWGHPEQDVANTIFGITRGVGVEDFLGVFQSSYERVRPWPGFSAELLADLFAARRLDMVNLALATNRSGLNDYVEHHCAALRDYLRS